MKRILCLALVVSFATLGAAVAEEGVAYPKGYRDWMHVKSMVIESGHPLYEAFGGIHHLYANEKAIEGYRGGGTFPTVPSSYSTCSKRKPGMRPSSRGRARSLA